VWTTLYISVAAAAAGTYRELSDQIHYAGYIFVGVIIAFIVLVFIGKKVIERVERKHLDDDVAKPTRADDADMKD
jgi:membrane protein DedA with SNARE-associated domain